MIFADITGVAYQSATRATVDVRLRVSNPNPRSYTVSSRQARVLPNGLWVSSVVLHHPLVISAGRTSEITIPAQVRLLPLASDSWNMAFSRHLPYLVQGTATISGSPRSIPIHFSGQIATSAITSAL